MKRITIVLDGVADRKNKELSNKTPLECAKTPNLDALYKKSIGGTVVTIPEGLEVGSAVGNLSMLGFDPTGYRGRAVVEAAGLDMPISNDDLYIRVNMVTFEGDSFENSAIKSYSAYEIATQKAEPVAKALKEAVYFGDYDLQYCGSFRNTLIVKGGAKLYPIDFMAAHDIIGQPIAPYIKTQGVQAPFFELMKNSYEFLQNSGTDINGVWFWGASIVPEIKGDITGRVALSETLLMDGITKITGIPNIKTNREGRSYSDFLEEKLKKAIDATQEYENIYLHFQETDDLSHEIQPKEKVEAIEMFDSLFLPKYLESLQGEYKIVLASDHFTFSDTGAHGGDPVPFLLYDSTKENSQEGRYTEQDCEQKNYCVSANELKNL